MNLPIAFSYFSAREMILSLSIIITVFPYCTAIYCSFILIILVLKNLNGKIMNLCVVFSRLNLEWHIAIWVWSALINMSMSVLSGITKSKVRYSIGRYTHCQLLNRILPISILNLFNSPNFFSWEGLRNWRGTSSYALLLNLYRRNFS